MADHLSRIFNAPIEKELINEDFLDEHILAIFKEPQYADIVNYLATGQVISEWTSKIDLASSPRYGSSFGKSLFKYCSDQIIRQCVPEEEHRSVLTFCHELACGGTLVPAKPPKRSYKVGSMGPLYSRIPSTFASHTQTTK